MMRNKLIVLLFIMSVFLCSCSGIKEYKGIGIDKITYKTIDYFGGFEQYNVIDFTSNEFLKSTKGLDDLKVVSSFSDEDEKIFIDGCYTYGLFNLEEKYTSDGIIDGGGWSLTIEYENGEKKISTGDNARPDKIFDNCSTYFYDLCGQQVLGRLPENYITPPNISISFQYVIGDTSYSTNGLTSIHLVGYLWNKHKQEDLDLLTLSEATTKFTQDIEYKVVLYTGNYTYEEKFAEIVIYMYDISDSIGKPVLTYTGKWMEELELVLKPNQIYTYTLKYTNGDYVTYMFHTRIHKID